MTSAVISAVTSATLNPCAPTVPTLSVMILAGGQSRRMGQDKALLSMPDGQPLLRHTLHVAQQLNPEGIVIVTPWPDRYQSLVPPQVHLLQEQVEPSDGLCAGPLSGFAQGWTQIASQWCLLLACDMPYLQSDPLQQWWTWLAMQNDNPQPLASLVPRSEPSADGKGDKIFWEPLCGFYHRRCVPRLIDHLSDLEQPSQLTSAQRSSRRSSQRSSQRSFQAWLKTLPIAPYRELPPRLLFNCNTPADWAVVQAV